MMKCMEREESHELQSDEIVQQVISQEAGGAHRRWGLMTLLAVLISTAAVGEPNDLTSQIDTNKFTASHSEEYDQHLESLNALHDNWAKLETKLRADGKPEEEIARSKSEFYEYMLTIWLTTLGHQSTLSAAERVLLLREIAAVMPKDYVEKADRGCAYTEESLPLQDFFEGVVLKFSNPMVYISDPDDDHVNCSPMLKQADYDLWSVESWDNIIFDKSRITEVPIDPSTTFTVEAKVFVKKGGIFGSERERYILRDSNGLVSVPPVRVFDSALLGEDSGSYLYENDVRVGHVVQDGVVWLEEDGVPAEVIEAHEPRQLRINFEDADSIWKRYEFLRRLMVAVEAEQLQEYTQSEVIELGLAKYIYEVQQGVIVNDYGGSVDILIEGSHVSVTFGGIPRGEDCFRFYYVNDPRVFGFSETYIDGVLEEYSESSTQSINAFKEKVCFSDKGLSEITFRGSLSKIQSSAQLTALSDKNPYVE